MKRWVNITVLKVASISFWKRLLTSIVKQKDIRMISASEAVKTSSGEGGTSGERYNLMGG